MTNREQRRQKRLLKREEMLAKITNSLCDAMHKTEVKLRLMDEEIKRNKIILDALDIHAEVVEEA